MLMHSESRCSFESNSIIDMKSSSSSSSTSILVTSSPYLHPDDDDDDDDDVDQSIDSTTTSTSTSPFHILPFKQRIASRKPSNLSLSISFNPELQDHHPIQESHPSKNSPRSQSNHHTIGFSPMQSQSQPSLRRHVLIRNAFLQSVRRDRNERLNQLRQAYYLPDEEDIPPQLAANTFVPLQQGPQEKEKDLSSSKEQEVEGEGEKESKINSIALKEAREEVKREMKRELRVRNGDPTTDQVESSSESEEDAVDIDADLDLDYDSDGSLSDSEEYYRARNQKFNLSIQSKSQSNKTTLTIPKRSISSLTCSASVKGTSSSFLSSQSKKFFTPSEPIVQISRPSFGPVQQQRLPTRPTSSPLQINNLSRPKATPVQTSSPSIRPSLTSSSKVQNQIQSSHNQETKSDSSSSTVSRPSLRRPGLQRSVPVNQVQFSLQKSSENLPPPSSSLEMVSQDFEKKDLGRRNCEETKEEKWFNELLNELGNEGKSGQNIKLDSSSSSLLSLTPHDHEKKENNELESNENKTGNQSESESSKSSDETSQISIPILIEPSSSLSDSQSDSDSETDSDSFDNEVLGESQELLTNDLLNPTTTSQSSTSVPSASTSPPLINSNSENFDSKLLECNSKSKSSSDSNSNSNSNSKVNISTWRNQLRFCDNINGDGDQNWRGRSFSFEDERIIHYLQDDAENVSKENQQIRNHNHKSPNLYRSNSDSILNFKNVNSSDLFSDLV